MAKLVAGIGASQSPLISIPAERWGDHGTRDMTNNRLYRPDGAKVSYADLATEAGDRFRELVALPNFIKVSAIVQTAVQRLTDDLADAKPDLLVVIADDQQELYDSSNLPAFSIYRGAELSNHPKDVPADAEQWIKDRRAVATIDPERNYPAAPDFANDLIERLIEKEFDVAAVSEPSNLAKGIGHKGIGHSWAFVANRLAGGRMIPIVPVILNTWFPPSVPTPARCYKLGQALRAAIEESPKDLRVAVIASGGLSHQVLNEELDRHVMAAFQTGDAAALTSIPRHMLRGGAGQILDWIVLAGAVEKLKNQWVEYQPGYRTPGGTGTGLAFASWR